MCVRGSCPQHTVLFCFLAPAGSLRSLWVGRERPVSASSCASSARAHTHKGFTPPPPPPSQASSLHAPDGAVWAVSSCQQAARGVPPQARHLPLKLLQAQRLGALAMQHLAQIPAVHLAGAGSSGAGEQGVCGWLPAGHRRPQCALCTRGAPHLLEPRAGGRQEARVGRRRDAQVWRRAGLQDGALLGAVGGPRVQRAVRAAHQRAAFHPAQLPYVGGQRAEPADQFAHEVEHIHVPARVRGEGSRGGRGARARRQCVVCPPPPTLHASDVQGPVRTPPHRSPPRALAPARRHREEVGLLLPPNARHQVARLQ